jgi:hypothetical protein
MFRLVRQRIVWTLLSVILAAVPHLEQELTAQLALKK